MLVIPAIAALTAATYQGKQRALAYGILGGVSGASMAAGPLIGGWVSANYTWRYVFAGESLVVLVILLFLRSSRRSGAQEQARHRRRRVVSRRPGVNRAGHPPLQPVGLDPPQGRCPRDQRRPADPAWTVADAVADHLRPVVLASSSAPGGTVKDRGDEPLLDLDLLKIPRMRAGLVVQWCQAFIIQATFFVVPLYLQMVLGFDALKTGLTILPMSVAMFVFALGGAALTGRFSPS